MTTTTGHGRAPRVAYFTMEYPRATDTFIQREVAELRRLGLTVDTFAARRPGDEHMVGDEQRTERERTDYVLPPSVGRMMGAQVSLFRRNPRRWLRAARLAVDTSRAGVRGHIYQLIYFLEAGAVAEQVEKRDIDHIHAHFGDVATSVAMLAAQLAGRTYSFTLHGPGVFFDANVWRLGTKIERAAFVSCISWFARSQAQLLSSEEVAERLHIIHCGVDPGRYEMAPMSHDETTRLVFVARLDHVKGLTVLLDAVASARSAGSAIELTVVGDGPSRRGFERHAAKVRVDDIVDFVGYRSQSDVAQILADSDVFVLPSFAEGVPVSLMEASASGLPVVATQVGGVSELVVDGRTGFIVPPGDAAALRDRIVTLAADAELRHRMGEAGRRRVEDDFDSRIEAARLARLYSAATADRVGPPPDLDGRDPLGALPTRPDPIDSSRSLRPGPTPTGELP